MGDTKVTGSSQGLPTFHEFYWKGEKYRISLPGNDQQKYSLGRRGWIDLSNIAKDRIKSNPQSLQEKGSVVEISLQDTKDPRLQEIAKRARVVPSQPKRTSIEEFRQKLQEKYKGLTYKRTPFQKRPLRKNELDQYEFDRLYEADPSFALPRGRFLADRNVAELIRSLNFGAPLVEVMTQQNGSLVTGSGLSTWLAAKRDAPKNETEKAAYKSRIEELQPDVTAFRNLKTSKDSYTKEQQNELKKNYTEYKKKQNGLTVYPIYQELLHSIVQKAEKEGFISIPLNLGNHFTQLLISVKKGKKIESIEYYDSFGTAPPRDVAEFIFDISNSLEQAGCKGVSSDSLPDAKFMNVRHQRDGNSCGIFSYLYVKYRAVEKKSIQEILSLGDALNVEVKNLRKRLPPVRHQTLSEGNAFRYAYEFSSSNLRLKATRQNKVEFAKKKPTPLTTTATPPTKKGSIDKKKPDLILREIEPLNLAAEHKTAKPLVAFSESMQDEVMARTNWALFDQTDKPKYSSALITRNGRWELYSKLTESIPVDLFYSSSIKETLNQAIASQKREVIFGKLTKEQVEELYTLLSQKRYQGHFETIYIAHAPTKQSAFDFDNQMYTLLLPEFEKNPAKRLFYFQDVDGKADIAHSRKIKRLLPDLAKDPEVEEAIQEKAPIPNQVEEVSAPNTKVKPPKPEKKPSITGEIKFERNEKTDRPPQQAPLPIPDTEKREPTILDACTHWLHCLFDGIKGLLFYCFPKSQA